MSRGRLWVLVVSSIGLAACSDAPTMGRRYALLADTDSSDWSAVTTGFDHTCALKRDGQAFCWGSNKYGQLGVSHTDSSCTIGGKPYGCSAVPLPVQTRIRFSMLSAGGHHTCGVTGTGQAYCWGANGDGQLGEYGPDGPSFVQVVSVLGWSQIAAGDSHTCALRVDGLVVCWGKNIEGQLGGGFASASYSPVRARMPLPATFLSAGSERTCALVSDGTVYCWGGLWLSRDAAGDEVTRTQTTPVTVPDAPALAGLSVGGLGTCGFDVTGFGYCWEGNPHGESGTGTIVGSITPQRIASTMQLVQISDGGAQACGIAVGGAAYCWGDDSYGQLGSGSSHVAERCTQAELPCSTQPVPVFGAQQFTAISTSLGGHTCGVTTRGNLYCWGNGSLGQLGDGTRRVSQSIPIKVAASR